MPVNASVEYFKAVVRFEAARSPEEKILAIEDVLKEMPKHKGAENLRAQWKSKYSKLKKEKEKSSKKSGKPSGVKKEGYGQVCIIGFTNSGKSTLLNRLTDAIAEIGDYEYTTKEPAIGMMDYNGVKIQLVEIPATMTPEVMSFARNADAIVFLYVTRDERGKLKKIKEDNYLKQKSIFLKSDDANAKEKIWDLLDLIIVYTVMKEKSKKRTSPMALPKGSTVLDFAKEIHKDFVKNFENATLFRNGVKKHVGLEYVLEEDDVVEIRAK